MSRSINLDAAVDVVAKWFENMGLNGDICLDGLRSLPPAQPEIIECKDCKHHRQNNYGDSWCAHPKGLDQFDLKPTDFCSRAERRTDERQT